MTEVIKHIKFCTTTETEGLELAVCSVHHPRPKRLETELEKLQVETSPSSELSVKKTIKLSLELQRLN
jgi:hypothetical protein